MNKIAQLKKNWIKAVQATHVAHDRLEAGNEASFEKFRAARAKDQEAHKALQEARKNAH